MTRAERQLESGTTVSEWLDGFAGFSALLSDKGPIRTLRDDAIGVLAEQGLPDRSDEDWRHSRIPELERKLLGSAAVPVFGEQTSEIREALASQTAIWPAQEVPGARFLNAQWVDQPDNSTAPRPAGVRVESLASTWATEPAALPEHFGRLAEIKRNGFVALNTAYAHDGAIITIDPGIDLNHPIYLLFVSNHKNQFSCPRILVRGGSGSRATVVVDHVSLREGGGFTNAVVEVFLAANAQLDWVVVQREGSNTSHINQTFVEQSRDSRFNGHTLSLGSGWIRNEIRTVLAGEGAEADLRGLFLGTGSANVENHTAIDHAVPHCTSREVYKGILAGTSRGVFRGFVLVRPDAQKTDSYQSNPNLLLNDRAEIDTQPQLEIHADDVKCSHGSSIGQLDDEALFYLRTRGLSLENARVLLTQGFAMEICDGLPSGALPGFAQALVTRELSQCLAAGT